MNNRKIILFLGASITQGMISVSFVRMLKEKLGTDHYKYMNHGIAGYESYNVLQKLDKAIRTKPEYVVILVGTNDVLSSLDPRLAKVSRKLKKIPHEPTLAHYSNNIKSIVHRLKKESGLEIALASLPAIGENLDSVENRTVADYNHEIKLICENEDISYLPVNEKQQAFLVEQTGGRGKDYLKSPKAAYKSLFLKYLLFVSLDSISRDNGYRTLTDGIHLNSVGAGFVADEVERFISSRQ